MRLLLETVRFEDAKRFLCKANETEWEKGFFAERRARGVCVQGWNEDGHQCRPDQAAWPK